MLIFIDTEFTDFMDAELISIGMVTEDGQHEFYAELPVNQEKCNAFVLTTILPQLGNVAGAQCTADELCDGLNQWLAPFAKDAPVICFDFDGDWRLLCHAMRYEIPEWLRWKNIYRYLDQVALQMYFIDNRIKDHHALHDAKANRYAFDREKAKADVMQNRKSR